MAGTVWEEREGGRREEARSPTADALAGKRGVPTTPVISSAGLSSSSLLPGRKTDGGLVVGKHAGDKKSRGMRGAVSGTESAEAKGERILSRFGKTARGGFMSERRLRPPENRGVGRAGHEGTCEGLPGAAQPACVAERLRPAVVAMGGASKRTTAPFAKIPQRVRHLESRRVAARRRRESSEADCGARGRGKSGVQAKS